MDLPIDFLRSVALAQLERGRARPLFVTVSGAHSYGFASPDSDFDLRGCHLIPLERAVALNVGRETLEHSGVQEGREIDFVSHDAGKFFRLMLKKNGYVMEQIFSPLVVVGGPALEELRGIARRCITRHIHHHYKGFSENQVELVESEPVKKAKSILYVYRVLLTGIHVLRTGEIEANLPKLLALYPQDGVDDLILAKTREKAPLSGARVASHRSAIDRLRGEMETAHAQSKLPESPEGAADLDAFLVRLRLSERRL